MLEGRREAGIPTRLRRVTVAGDFADHLPGPPPRIGERQIPGTRPASRAGSVPRGGSAP